MVVEWYQSFGTYPDTTSGPMLQINGRRYVFINQVFLYVCDGLLNGLAK